MPNRRDLLGLCAAAGLAGSFAGRADATQIATTNSASPQPNLLRFGWIPDAPDRSDEELGALPKFNGPLPKTADMTKDFPVPYDQGELNSCTANAIAAAVQYARRKNNKGNDFVPSRLFIYYYERLTEHRVPVDFGAQLRNGIKAVAEKGCPPEGRWPYDSPAPDLYTRVFPTSSRAIAEPPADVLNEAFTFRSISYSPLRDRSLNGLRGQLAMGFPIIFGFSVYSNFDSKTLRLQEPTIDDSPTYSGHAVLAVGYDDEKRTFRIRNSWGPSANDGGYFDMDYGYVTDPDLTSDFWVIYETNAMLQRVVK